VAQFYQAKKSSSGNKHKKRVGKHALTSSAYKDEVVVTKLDHSGKGICLKTQPITVVEGALPTENCEVVITRENKKLRTASLSKVLTPHASRRQAFCEYYGKCGGCSMQHTSAEFAINEKYAALKTYLQRQHNVVADEWATPLKSNITYNANSADDAGAEQTDAEQTGYRRRIRLAVDARNLKNIKIGYRERGSQNVLNISHCPISIQSINMQLPAINALLQGLPSISHVGHVVITSTASASGDGSQQARVNNKDDTVQLALFAVKELSAKSIKLLQDFAIKQQIEIIVKHKSSPPILINTDLETLSMDLGQNIKQAVAADQFLQVNAGVNQKMLDTALEWLSPSADSVLYDFFCGSGNFSLVFANQVKQVFGFEGVNAMVKAAKHNAATNNINNCEFATCDLSNEKAIANINIAKNSLVILDPSREGASELCMALAAKPVAKILYVSCNPNSFARDLAHLNQSFEVSKITVLDMFPFTSHLEVMALLQAKTTS